MCQIKNKNLQQESIKKYKTRAYNGKTLSVTNMAFMMKKKRYKFQADLCLDELTEVSYSKAILFAKIRQLDGGSFQDVSRR